jgi:hypothetical protein
MDCRTRMSNPLVPNMLRPRDRGAVVGNITHMNIMFETWLYGV